MRIIYAVTELGIYIYIYTLRKKKRKELGIYIDESLEWVREDWIHS